METNPQTKPFYTLPAGQYVPDEVFPDLFLEAPDKKYFLDAIPLRSTEEILKDYHQEKSQGSFNAESFIQRNFKAPPEPAKDFCSHPDLPITDHIELLWPILTQQPCVEKSSLISLPKPYVVPGGHFREIYYWDTFFTILGLQQSGKTELIENMVENFAYLIDTVGHIPNGNRTYYASRSQPPFYALIVDVLAQEKGKDIWRRYGPTLRKEYEFWMEGAEGLKEPGKTHRRVVKMPDGSVLNRYWDDKPLARQEGHIIDTLEAKQSGRNEEDFYRNIRAACESGWDFSSRWFADKKSTLTIRASEIIPVDLNSLLYFLELSLVEVSELEGNKEETEEFKRRAEARKAAILKYFWNKEDQFFYDYDFVNAKTTDVPTLAAVYPLYFNIAEAEQAGSVAKKLEKEFLKAGGLLTTVINSGHQWDAPNGWAPLQWMSIKGLRNFGQNELADVVSQRWVDLNVGVYKRTGKLMEKYNVEDVSLEGGGGQYENQDGFGWTNGVLLKLLSLKK